MLQAISTGPQHYFPQSYIQSIVNILNDLLSYSFCKALIGLIVLMIIIKIFKSLYVNKI